MTLDLDAIAREAELYFGSLDDHVINLSAETLSRFSALLLEKVAHNHDEAAREWERMAEGCNSSMYDDKAMAAHQLADDVRQMRAALSARKPLSNAQSQLEALEDLIEDLSEWSRHVIEDTAPATLEKHVREVLKRHGINGLEVKT